jgi:hypothetical protein
MIPGGQRKEERKNESFENSGKMNGTNKEY